MVDKVRLENSAHLDAVRRFARGNEIAEASAVAIYERERHELSARAKLDRFVGILAEKRAKAVIVRMRIARSARP
jgi:hypothetical protein